MRCLNLSAIYKPCAKLVSFSCALGSDQTDTSLVWDQGRLTMTEASVVERSEHIKALCLSGLVEAE